MQLRVKFIYFLNFWLQLALLRATPIISTVLYPQQEKYGNSNKFSNFMEIIRRIQGVKKHALIYYRNENCVFTELLPKFQKLQYWPVLLPFPNTTDNDIKSLDKNLLVIGCERYFNDSIPPLLHKLTANRLVQLQNNTLYAVQLYCASCQDLEVVNTILIPMDFQRTGTYYNCLMVPRSTTNNFKQRNINEDNNPPYQAQYMNMRRTGIHVEFDYVPHRTMEDEEFLENGYPLRGYLANLMTSFARRHNATLLYAKRLNNTIFNDKNMTARTKAGEYDVGVTLDPITRGWLLYTYPYDISAVCFINPVEKDFHLSAILAHVLPWSSLAMLFGLQLLFVFLLNYTLKTRWHWSLLILDDKTLRGMLGQSFPLPNKTTLQTKYVCLLLFTGSLVIITTFNAMGQSYATRSPKAQGIRYYEDLERLNLKIYITANSWKALVHLNKTALLYRHLYVQLSSEEFAEKLESFVPGFVFPVLYARWLIIKQEFQRFPSVHFEFNENLCFTKFAQLGLPIRPQLPYRDLLDRHVMDMQEMGFKKYWILHTYYHLKRLGHTRKIEARRGKDFDAAVDLSDFDIIWNFYFIFNAVAIVCFIVELSIYHWKWRALFQTAKMLRFLKRKIFK